MASISQGLSDRFHRWEERTRGRLLFPHPVPPEPPFLPFPGHFLSPTPTIDDGRRPTGLSKFVQSFWAKPPAPPPEEPDEDAEPTLLERGAVTEFPLYLPTDFDTKDGKFQSFIRSLSTAQEPVGFELIGTGDEVITQVAVGTDDRDHFQQQLRAYFPEIVSTPTEGTLETTWQNAGPAAAVLEFGLASEAVLLLAKADHDVFVALVGALSELAPDECGVFQVLWQSVTEDWSDSLLRAVTDANGKPFFVNAPELADAARTKTGLPLYAAVVRMAACSANYDRTWDILKRMASALRAFSNPNGNELVPLRNDDYPYEAHLDDLIRRQSRRPGMILNAEELIGFVHLPSSAVRSKKFRRLQGKSKLAPATVTNARGVLLGINEHAGERREVRLTPEQRVRHMHVVGASGTGKSTLLFNLIRQDIEAGQGIGVLDPHGDLIDQILCIIPPGRVNDVVLVDPSDETHAVGFNILSAHSDWEKNLLAADLVSVFRRLSTSWGDQMDRVLSSAILAFLESERGGTLLDLRRFLVEPAFREKFLASVRDPEVVYYWRKGFALLSGNKSIGPVLTRLETFLSPKPIRYMVAQRENRIDFGDILDSGKIFLAKLSQGAVGKENSHLLGSLFVAKFQQLAMSRQRQAASQRRDFWLYVDEFQDFITPSMAEMLVGTRKYRVGLILAHQDLRQVQRDEEVAGALSHAFTRVCFRVGDQDARTLASGMSFFEASDLQNLDAGQAVCRVERADFDFNLSVPMAPPPDAEAAASRREAATRASRERYARPRAEVEAALRAELDITEAPKPVNKRDIPPDTQSGTAVRTPTPPPPASPTVVEKQSPDSVAETPQSPKPIPSPTPPAPVSAQATPVNPAPPVSDTKAQTALEIEGSHWGKGGPKHHQIQTRIKVEAEKLGFFVPPEEQAGSGQIDLVLRRGEIAIACEISYTSHVADEVAHIDKCSRAGYTRIATISLDRKKLVRIERAVARSLSPEVAAKVSYHTPDDFIEYLRSLPTPLPPPDGVVMHDGLAFTREIANLSEEQAKQAEAIGLQAIVDALRKTPRT